MTARELNYLIDIRADFDTFLSQRNWEQAAICINDMGDRGAELEALKMHQELNRAKRYLCANYRGTCKEQGKHTDYCREWNKETGEWTLDNEEDHD